MSALKSNKKKGKKTKQNLVRQNLPCFVFRLVGWFSLLATRASKWRNISWLFDKGLVCLLRHSLNWYLFPVPFCCCCFDFLAFLLFFFISARANIRFALHIIYVCTSGRRVTCARNPLAAKHRVAERQTNVNFSCFKSENWDGPQRSLSSPDNEELSLSLFRWRMSLDIYNLVDFFLLLFFFSLVCFFFCFLSFQKNFLFAAFVVFGLPWRDCWSNSVTSV